MSIRSRLPNPMLSMLHPRILPRGVARILLVGSWSNGAERLFGTLRRVFPDATVTVLAPATTRLPIGLQEMWIGDVTDSEVVARARRARFDLLAPLEPYGLMGETRPELERFALRIGARAVAVYETTYGTVRIATRAHLRYRVYLRPWVCRAFGAALLAIWVAPLYGVYLLARWLGLWRGEAPEEDRA